MRSNLDFIGQRSGQNGSASIRLCQRCCYSLINLKPQYSSQASLWACEHFETSLFKFSLHQSNEVVKYPSKRKNILQVLNMKNRQVIFWTSHKLTSISLLERSYQSIKLCCQTWIVRRQSFELIVAKVVCICKCNGSNLISGYNNIF